jgi:hypothetical protein
LVYISLETPKEDMYFNLYCRHSLEEKFNKYNCIPHDNIRQMKLSQEQFDYLHSVVVPDLSSPSLDRGGNPCERGQLIILDESDFVTMSFTDIYNVLEQIDIKLGGKLDGFIVDYAQLCKFTDNAKGMDDNRIINSYITFFRRLTQKFRSGKHKKKLIGIILSQINRTSWLKASRKDGYYDLTCLADANELERGSYRVMTTYTTEEKKNAGSAQVQILKNRGGTTMLNPLEVSALGESYYFGDSRDNVNATLGVMESNNLADVFDIFNNNIFLVDSL